MIKVLITKRFFPNDLEYINSRVLPGCKFIFPQGYSKEELIDLAVDANVFFGGTLFEEMVQKAKNLKLIQVPWTGVDTMDISFLSKYNVILCNSHSNSEYVAEFAIALMYSLIKKIPYHDFQLRKGYWNRPKSDGSNTLSPFSYSLKNLTLGILGFGSVGKKIKSFLSPYSAKWNIYTDLPPEKSLNDTIFYSEDELSLFFNSTDLLFICLPLTDKTKNLIDFKLKDSIKQGSFWINISRGEIINERLLFECLKEGILAGVAIDTWYIYPSNENPAPFPSNYPIHLFDNVILSPHRAAMVEGSLSHLDDAIENLNRLIRHQPLINEIDITKQY